MLQAAQYFVALRNAGPRLVDHYDNVQSKPMTQQLSFPYPTSVATTQGTEAHVTYRQQLSLLCFTGLTQPHDQVVFINTANHTALLHMKQGQLQDLHLHFLVGPSLYRAGGLLSRSS